MHPRIFKLLNLLALASTCVSLLFFCACAGGTGQAPITQPPPQPPSSLTYATGTATYIVGTPITPNRPSSSGGPVSFYSVSPALPAGLTLSTSTGVISGVPTAVSATSTYLVTASNAAGTTSARLTITVNPAPPGPLSPPASLEYSTSTAVYVVGTQIVPNDPTSSGGPASAYSVIPSLPAGLILDAGTGVISGIPTAVSAMNAYTVTASNAAGSTSATLTISVDAAQVEGPPIPASFWGLHVLKVADFAVEVPYGEFRHWDTQAQWPQIETCAPSPSSNPISADPCFNWTIFDQETASLKTNPFSVSGIQPFAIDDTFYTLSRTPAWASTNPTDTNCDGALSGQYGQCDLPADINADGSGTNQTWKTWITALATHANGLDDPTHTYLQTHAHIKYWEPWNEWYRNPLVLNWSGIMAVRATYAQMLRLTEDARCIITGKGTIHNFPSAGAATACAQTGLDPTAMIVTPSSGSNAVGYRSVMQNFLYCNGSGASAPKPGSQCTWSGQDWGSQAVDIIDFHFYAAFQSNTLEEVANTEIPAVQSFLKSADLAKPLWNGEGSWGVVSNPNNIWAGDAYARAGFIARMFALYWSAGLAENFFYSYDGFLFKSPSGLIQPEATAWTTTYNWLAGATAAQNPFCQSGQLGLPATVYSCAITRAGGYTGLVVWDPQYGPGGTSSPANCTTSSNPTICGNTTITVPSNYGLDWVDIGGTVHPFSATLTVGANPILLEGP